MNRFSFWELLEVLLLAHKLKLVFGGLKENKNGPCATDLSLYSGHPATGLTKTCGKPVKSRQCQQGQRGQGLKSDTGSAEKALSFFQKTPFRHELKWLYPGRWKELRKQSYCPCCLLSAWPVTSVSGLMGTQALVKMGEQCDKAQNLLTLRCGNLEVPALGVRSSPLSAR